MFVLRVGFFATILCLEVLGMTANGVDDALASKCAAVLQKVPTCLSFVTKKAVSPSRECCGSVTDLSHSDPACLCFIILQVHNGSNTAIKSMGVSETRMLLLPYMCTAASATVIDCPRVLQLPLNSTDAAIFNVSTIINPIFAPGPTFPDHGFWSKPPQQLYESIIVSAVIFFVAFPSGLLLLP
ncbi:hypothetical protein ACJIZ3_003500 [Penstemon smallii]|uniref:Bifunctional inhibitor/plant lipid transfer protein/seed storage helical domain-containing protein n=1 Tax=Penstemon smallii TaxID=265156 RepID=A0ABD3UCU5_9LAMI